MMIKMPTQAERIAALETQVNHMYEQVKETNKKLDELLALRNKGLGAFWLASTLIGTSFIGLLTAIFGWYK